MWKLYTNRSIPPEQQATVVQFDHRLAEFGEDKQDEHREPEEPTRASTEVSTNAGVDDEDSDGDGSPEKSDSGAEDPPIFRCEKCDQNFVSNRNLRRHFATRQHKNNKKAKKPKKKGTRRRHKSSDSELDQSVRRRPLRSKSSENTENMDFVEVKQEVDVEWEWDENDEQPDHSEDSGPGQDGSSPSSEEEDDPLPPPRKRRRRKSKKKGSKVKAKDAIWTCSLCELKFREQTKLAWHLDSDAHKAVKEMEDYLNDPANIIMPGDSDSESTAAALAAPLDQDGPVHTCEVCNTSYNAKDNLERHKMTQMHQKNVAAAAGEFTTANESAAALPVYCDVCDQTFHRHLALLRHLKTEKHRQTAEYKQLTSGSLEY